MFPVPLIISHAVRFLSLDVDHAYPDGYAQLLEAVKLDTWSLDWLEIGWLKMWVLHVSIMKNICFFIDIRDGKSPNQPL